MVTPWVADCSAAHPTVAQLRAAGAVGVIRYLDPGRNDGTEITAAEVADYTANAFPYGLVMEYAADWLEGGYNVGHADGLAALAEEGRLGIPHGVIYLACDFDIQPGQYAGALATMQGFADSYGGWPYVRPYGSKSFCEWVQANSPARGSWSTFAWSFNTAAGQFEHAADARLWQYNYWPAGTPLVAGCDYNQVLGDWAPRNGDDMFTPQDEVLLKTIGGAVYQGFMAVQVALNAIKAEVDGLKANGAAKSDVAAMEQKIAAVGTAVEGLSGVSGGTVDPAAIAAAVSADVKTITWKAS